MTLQYKHNLYTLSPRNMKKKLTKKLTFLLVSKANTNNFNILRQCMYIIYLYVI
jgi:hypothetical protein